MRENRQKKHSNDLYCVQRSPSKRVIHRKKIVVMGASNTVLSKWITIKSSNDFEQFSLIWLDESFSKNKKHYEEAEEIFRSIFNRLKIFQDPTKFTHFIKSSSKTDRIVLIINDELIESVVPKIHSCKALVAIYVFTAQSHVHESWTTRFSKVNFK